MLKTFAKNIRKHTVTQLLLVPVISVPLLLSGCSTTSGLSNKQAEQSLQKNSEATYFTDSQKYIQKKRYAEAERALEDLRIHYANGQYSKQALLDLIYVRIQKGDYEQAILTANSFLSNYPTHSQADYAWYAKGIANMKMRSRGLIKYTNLNLSHRDVSSLRAAFADFNNLVQRHPNSVFKADAIQRMYHIYNQFAEHEMQVARFNLKRKAYLGAVDRARMVFLGFPQSPQTPEAIATIAVGYEKLGLQKKANQYKQLLALNYPNLLVDNKVKLDESRSSPSILNRLTLGLFGKASEYNVKGDGFQSIRLSTDALEVPVLPDEKMMITDPSQSIIFEGVEIDNVATSENDIVVPAAKQGTGTSADAEIVIENPEKY